jgi:dipeptidyl aminopeptidase/acylaminoacyl peptidase
MGWSDGGLITLINQLARRKDFVVAYARVPVCGLVPRVGNKSRGCHDLLSAPYHIGKTTEEDVNEYRRRSPARNAEKVQTPPLAHATSIDEDVNMLEVEHLSRVPKAATKAFEHKAYKDAPGGHEFTGSKRNWRRRSGPRWAGYWRSA